MPVADGLVGLLQNLLFLMYFYLKHIAVINIKYVGENAEICLASLAW